MGGGVGEGKIEATPEEVEKTKKSISEFNHLLTGTLPPSYLHTN